MSQLISRYNAPNDGQVKVNDGNGLKARWANGDADSINDTWQQVAYAAPLGLSAAPTTQWPSNVITPSDTDVYDFTNDTFLENPVLGQVHIWRVTIKYDKGSSNTNTRFKIQLDNTLSGFLLENQFLAPGSFSVGEFNTEFITIADSASLPAPLGTGQGYRFRVQADNNNFQNNAGSFFEIDSITRISLQHGAR